MNISKTRFGLFLFFNLLTISMASASGAKLPEVVSPELASKGTNTHFEAIATEAYSSPWKKDNTSIVIDAYEGNAIDWSNLNSDSKVVGIVHRASIGNKTDSAYESRKSEAIKRGYLWGAYHLGLRGNTIAQAQLFLSKVKNDSNTLLVLDLEDTSNSNFMSVNEAMTFMQFIYDQTGKIPIVYANQATVKELNSKMIDNPLLQQSKLWYARFTSSIKDFPRGIWDGYFLWQFSSELNCSTTGACLYNVPGTKADMDVNVFYGPKSELESQWNN